MPPTFAKLLFRLSLGIAMLSLFGLFQGLGGIAASSWGWMIGAGLVLAWIAHGRIEKPAAPGDFARMLNDRQANGPRDASGQAPDTESINRDRQTVTVIGLSGASGGSGMGRDWKWHVALKPWRIKGERLQTSELEVCMPGAISKKAFDKLQEDFQREQIVELQVVDLRDASYGNGKEAELAAILTRDATDEELLQALADRSKPFDIDIEGIGKLAYDPEEGHFIGTVAWAGSQVRLLVETDDREELCRYSDALRPLFTDATSWNKTIREYAADALLKEEHASLLKSTYRSLDKQQRMQKLVVEMLTLMEDGDFLASFAADEIADDLEIHALGNIPEGMLSMEIY